MGQITGALIKEARTGAKLTQTQLAEQLDGVSANDISKAERGDKELSQSVLKQIAKITGVTQSSLVNAAKADAAGEKPAAAKTTTKKESGAKTASKTETKTASKTETKTASKTEAKTAAKTDAKTASKTEAKNAFELTAAEKKLVELYRAADSETKKAAVALLKNEKPQTDDILGTLLGGAMEMLTNMKK